MLIYLWVISAEYLFQNSENLLHYSEFNMSSEEM
jgi:hypothetical protein